jgi:hypothetical protein
MDKDSGSRLQPASADRTSSQSVGAVTIEYVVVYKGRNWPSNVDGPNVALTVWHGDRAYFQFYICAFPPTGAFDFIAPPWPRAAGGGHRLYQALTKASVEKIEADIRSGYRPDTDEFRRVNARYLAPDPARVRALDRGVELLPEIREGLFGGIEIHRFSA